MNVGQRVRVNIRLPEEYAFGAASCLNGKVGVVEEISDRTGNLRFCVLFDTPAPTWWGNQLPVTGFWFDQDELESE